MKNNNRCYHFQFAAISIAIFLSACGSGGGGGGESTSSSAPPPGPVASTLNFPIEATVMSLVTTSSTFTVYAADSQGNGYTLTASYAPGQPTYNSKLYSSALPTFFQSALLKTNGVTSDTSNAQVFYSTSPFLIWGSVMGTDTMRIDTHTALPATAKIGAIGSIYSGKIYINNSTLFPDSQSATWSLEADTADTAWLCLNTIEIVALSLGPPTFEADCFKINSSGSVLGFKVDVTIPVNCGAYSCDTETLKFR